MTFKIPSDQEEIKELNEKIEELTDDQIFTNGSGETALSEGTFGRRNTAEGRADGLRGTTPRIHQLTENDESGTPTGTFDRINLVATLAIIEHTSTPMSLKFINGKPVPGTTFRVTPKAGKALTIETGGDFDIASPISLVDNEYADFIFFSETETGITDGAFRSLKVGTGGDISLPIRPPIDDRGTVTTNQTFILSNTTGHVLKLTLGANIDIIFNNFPIIGFQQEWEVEIIQDDTTPFVITWPGSVVNPPDPSSYADLGSTTIVVFRTNDAGTTIRVGNTVTTTAGVTTLSDLAIDVNKDWQDQGISNFGSLTGVTGIDMNGTTALIQGIKELRFFDDDPDKKIISVANAIEYKVPTLEAHDFFVGGTQVASFNEDVGSVFELDLFGNRIGDIGDLFFDLAGGDIVINRFSMEYDQINFAARINVPVGDQFRFQEGGSTVVSFVPFAGIGYTINDSVGLFLDDALNNPTNNGEIQLNGIDVFVFSGNSLRNMSNIGIAAGGADVFLSNLSNPTAINQNLNFSSTLTNNITNLGNLDFENVGQSIIPLSNGIRHDVPTGDAHKFRVNLIDIAEINLDGIKLFGNSLILDSDEDTEINSLSDDSMQFITGAGLRMTISNSAILPSVQLSMSNLNKITSVLDPTNPQDVVTKAFGDANYLGGGEFFGPWTAAHDAGGFTLNNINNVDTAFITASNTVQFNGDVILGSSSANSVFFNGELATDIIPQTSSIDFGDSVDQFRDIYLQSGFNSSKIFFDGGGDTYLTGSGSSGRINVVSDGINTIGFTPTALFLSDGVNISVATSTGTQIATTSSQKLGFFGATPIVRPPTPASNSAAIITALQSLGLFT